MKLTTSQQQAMQEVIPVILLLLQAGWWPKKFREAAKIAVGALQVIMAATQAEPLSASAPKAALSEQARTVRESIGDSF